MYEYDIKISAYPTGIEQLNELGREGWELVTCSLIPAEEIAYVSDVTIAGNPPSVWLYYFKRSTSTF
jgi:hypothetical protein